ncbi:MAG: metallophosphoesterase family protein [Antarcticimicrobium sp.]|uniref:metallophosphoesterase family protein n=1 Tax=Antarcticimicrobium sp. TaxID=2824147 RepID=UPI00263870F5|nr:metallophosphoesterase family protein [Antarcticimicrobium sp.]MDF1718097.1 metallophosphoesterase family protein [Antarcticimicrobium sp.]
MKILAFSDLHMARRAASRLVKASVGADLVVGAGDFCNARQGLDQAMEMLSGITAPMVLVPGNAESADELRAAALPNATVLHGEGAEVEGLRFFGIGGGVPPTPFGAWSWDLSEEAAEALLAPCAAADILITHSPPRGVADRTSQGVSVGSEAIRAAIARIAPPLVLCGHIHDCWGERGHIGGSEVVNLGPEGAWFEIGA